MTFRRYRYLFEYWEESPRSDDILAAVHLKKSRRHIEAGVGMPALAGMFGLDLNTPGQVATMRY